MRTTTDGGNHVHYWLAAGLARHRLKCRPLYIDRRSGDGRGLRAPMKLRKGNGVAGVKRGPRGLVTPNAELTGDEAGRPKASG